MKTLNVSTTIKEVIEAKSITYNNIVYEMKKSGIDITVLSLGEAFFDIPLYPFDDLPFPDIYHYSHSRGIIELRNKLSEYFNKEYDVQFNPETEIIITAGSKIAIHMSLMTILNPGEEVLIFEPYWVSYTEQVKLCNCVPVTIPKHVGINEIEGFITDKTKAIIVNTPHNPLGKIYGVNELKFLFEIAKKYNLFLLSDEAYSDFIPEDAKFYSLGNIDKHFTNSIIFNSISKNYGISGWRLGYSISNPSIINQILKINQHLITCPATILEYYVAKHFYEIIEITKPQIKKVVEYRAKIAEYMTKIGIEYMVGSAAWYFVVSMGTSKLNSDEFCMKLLKEHHISVVPGSGYGQSCEHDFRLAVGIEPWERVTKALDTIKNLIIKTS